MSTKRIDKNRVLLNENSTLSSYIYANDEIKLEQSAIDEANTFSTLDGIQNLAFTPDFHKGAGTPIGTTAKIDRVYPKVIGPDIGCGMRLDVTDLYELPNVFGIPSLDSISNLLRRAYFEGGRIVNTPNKKDVLRFGLQAKIEGKSARRIPMFNNAHQGGALGFGTESINLEAYYLLEGERDNFLGTIGGGNHFVELQQVSEIVDRQRAFELGLKHGAFCIMSHSGSLDMGHVVHNYYTDKAKEKHKGRHPAHGYFGLENQDAMNYIEASYNAANFASVNRAVLNSMMADVLCANLKSVYDSPHNLVWYEDNHFLHRKGSCPAGLDELVIIPGSMGTRSCLAIGKGFEGTMGSSAHGAGRVLNRNAARNQEPFKDINLVTKIDPTKVRSDIAKEVMKNMAEEAPRAYKDVEQVVRTSVDSGILSVVAWLSPVLTVKG